MRAVLTAALIAAPVMGSIATAQTTRRFTAQDAISTRSVASADPAKKAISSHQSAQGSLPNALSSKNPLQRSLAASPEYRVFDSLINAFSYFTGGQEPFVYDAASNTLATIKRGADGNSNNLYIRTSQNLGVTWSEPKLVYDAADGDARYPSMMIINRTNSTDPATLLYYFTAPTLGPGGESFGNYVTGLADGTFNVLTTEIDNGVDGSTWATSAKSLLTADGSAMLVIGDLSENNLGLRRYSTLEGTGTSSIPEQWNSSNFVDPGSADSRTAVTVGIGRDMSGSDNTIYAAIFSRFPAAEEDGLIAPMPAISSSTDNGATWSNFEFIPRSVITAYGNSQGALGDSVRFIYNQAQDFMVMGPNKVSFVLNLFEINADRPDTDPFLAQAVEAYRDNGVWGIRKIADLTGSQLNVIADLDPEASQLANELQIARTADGSKLIAKWTDLTQYTFDADINDDGVSPDTLLTSDVFMASRPANGTTWGTAVNVTETPIRDLVTWIPSTLPNDLSKLPMLTLRRNLNGVAVTTLQDSLTTLQAEVVEAQLVTITNIDATLASGVEEGQVTARSGMTLNALYPNPANGQASISFTTTKPGRVALDIFNVSGERVMSLYNATMESGEHTLPFSAAGLAPGAYYYRLQSNGEALTKAFTVVR